MQREKFEAKLASILGEGASASCALLLIELGGLKAVKGAEGELVAEQVAGLVSQRIETALREPDTAFRFDDQFVVLLDPAPAGQDAVTVASRIADLLQRAYLVRGQLINLTANIGIVLAPACGTEAELLLKRAGMALRDARIAGAGAVHLFEAAEESRLIARNALAVDLRKALLLRQLELHYQPQVDIATQQIVGVEALLRWRHPTLGLVPPGDFIPLAEETGLIVTIGDWVLRTACQQAARLPEEIVVAINASAVQFRNKDFVASVERALTIAGIPASRIEIEITEGVLLQCGPAAGLALDELREMGVRLAMDDFGTGYSSFGQLSRLPIDTLKIDRSLVGAQPKQRAIVRAIAMLGTGLGMTTLVEGVETEQQRADALADGCLSAQGYFFGKAIPAAELERVFARLSDPDLEPEGSSIALIGTCI